MYKINNFLLTIFLSQLCAVLCENDLVFVIDDTGSMMDDIDQVKTKVDELFDAAYNSNSSQIEEFIIVTFNDPDVKLRTKTKDRDVFKKALNDIKVDGGGDCPEMALTGLALALQEARKNSFVYLFTDASAKDNNKTEMVKTMAKEKKCRLFFMVTGNCYDGKDVVYNELASATEGQVFNLEKKEVAEILGYARETVAGGFAASVALSRPAALESADFEDRASFSGERISNFELDEATKEVLVSVSASDPEVTVTGPDGTAPKIQDVANTSGSKLFFMVTGNCYDGKDVVYNELASATEGQVFNLEKKEVAEILGYARETVAGGFAASVALSRPAALESADFEDRASFSGERISNFELDEATKEVLVSVSASDPEVTVTGPDGTAPKIQDVANTSGSKVFKILEAKPGAYSISVKSKGPSSVIVNKKPVT